MSLFKTHTQEDYRKSIASFLPNGKSFDAKNDENEYLFLLLLGLALELMRADGNFNLLAEEQDVRFTTLLIERWEAALGIPDGCFSGTGSLDDRRTSVLAKLSLKIDTRDSFIKLAALFGFKCTINGGSTYGRYPLPYPWTYYGSDQEMNFTMYVHLDAAKKAQVYPFTIPLYPWPYSGDASNIIECLFKKIRPANVKIVFIYDL